MASDRLRAAILSILDSLQPTLKYAYAYEYRVVSATSAPPIRVDARSMDPTMPDLAGIELWPGPDGSVAVPSVGSRIRVGYIAGRPAVIGLDPEVPPSRVYLGAIAGPPVARVGDTVLVSGVQAGGGTALGTITTGSAITSTP